jgi:hypothetical protein
VPRAAPSAAIRAPWSDRARLAAEVRALRARGEIVVQVLLPATSTRSRNSNATESSLGRAGRWMVRALRRD